jgi:hypothetical protein
MNGRISVRTKFLVKFFGEEFFSFLRNDFCVCWLHFRGLKKDRGWQRIFLTLNLFIFSNASSTLFYKSEAQALSYLTSQRTQRITGQKP